VTDELRALVDDEDPYVRTCAIHSLGWVLSPERLAGIVADDPHAVARAYAVAHLSTGVPLLVSGEEHPALTHLLGALEADPSSGVRITAAKSLVWMGSLYPFYTRDFEPAERRVEYRRVEALVRRALTAAVAKEPDVRTRAALEQIITMFDSMAESQDASPLEFHRLADDPSMFGSSIRPPQWPIDSDLGALPFGDG
jgi:HEAT repeat protein